MAEIHNLGTGKVSPELERKMANDKRFRVVVYWYNPKTLTCMAINKPSDDSDKLWYFCLTDPKRFGSISLFDICAGWDTTYSYLRYPSSEFKRSLLNLVKRFLLPINAYSVLYDGAKLLLFPSEYP